MQTTGTEAFSRMSLNISRCPVTVRYSLVYFSKPLGVALRKTLNPVDESLVYVFDLQGTSCGVNDRKAKKKSQKSKS